VFFASSDSYFDTMVSLIIIILLSCDATSLGESASCVSGIPDWYVEIHEECTVYDPTLQVFNKPLQCIYSLKSYEV